MNQSLPPLAVGATRYTIEHRDNCILIYGGIPMDALPVLAQLTPRRAILSPRLAGMAGANLAWGLGADLDALIAKVKPEALNRVRNMFSGRGLSNSAFEWLAAGEQGTSSMSMFTVLTGVNVMRGHPRTTPRDGDDFARCRKLLEACPELAPLLSTMSNESPAWAKLVENWTVLCASMDAEAPNWRVKGGRTPNTDAMLASLDQP